MRDEFMVNPNCNKCVLFVFSGGSVFSPLRSQQPNPVTITGGGRPDDKGGTAMHKPVAFTKDTLRTNRGQHSTQGNNGNGALVLYYKATKMVHHVQYTHELHL